MANLAQQYQPAIQGITVTDSDGFTVPAAGCKIYLYDAGTLNDRTGWSDHDRSTPVSQPFVCDSDGRGLLYLHGAYKIIIHDSSDVEISVADNQMFTRNQFVDPVSFSGGLSITGDFTADTTTLHVDADNNRVGVGTITPSSLFHVSSTEGAKFTLSADSDNNGANDDPQIVYELDGAVKFSHGVDDSDSDKFVFSVGGVVGTSNAMEIDSSGVVAIKGGLISDSVDAKTTTFTASTDKDFYECSSSGGAYTITLPAISGISGKRFTFKKTSDDVNAITIDADGSETIDGSANTTIDTIGETLTLVATGTEWQILQRSTSTDWISRTVTGTWTSGATYTCKEKREGTDALYDIYVECSGAVTAANLSITLPTGRTIDTSAMTNSGIRAPLLSSHVLLFDISTGNEYYGGVALASTTQITPNVLHDNGTNESWSVFHNTDFFTKASGDFVSIRFRVPIVGWKS